VASVSRPARTVGAEGWLRAILESNVEMLSKDQWGVVRAIIQRDEACSPPTFKTSYLILSPSFLLLHPGFPQPLPWIYFPAPLLVPVLPVFHVSWGFGNISAPLAQMYLSLLSAEFHLLEETCLFTALSKALHTWLMHRPHRTCFCARVALYKHSSPDRVSIDHDCFCTIW
jgi:hypothetical protein